ncbi:hypothetical protein FPOAC1_011339 [Fusarium poae]|uniref:hypothetical protein n=1 Tax=Fusarium poae TaxID=36050 RepID=UPI001CEB5227|nr:hypothetical protein FPOAC1_011339 [Fusarium poae]KAG8666530.1 hypothetical protein FPOAC1_011339 [Fusarium poae]
MSSSIQGSLRLQTTSHNDVESTKTKAISTVNIINGNQERTPKSESVEAPVRLQAVKSPVRLPTSSCLDGLQSHDLSDTEIANRLDWCVHESTAGKRVGDLSRTVLQLTGMWPWDFAAGFLPKKWDIKILEDIRRLLRSVCKSAGIDGPGPHTKIVQNFLLGCAKKRDSRCLHLQHSDVLNAISHFSADFYTKRGATKPIHTPPVQRQAEQIIVQGSDEESGSDESDDDQNEAIEIPDSQNEGEDWTGHDFDDSIGPTDQNETATVTVKRSRSPSLTTLLEKRPRTTGPSHPYHDTNATILQDPTPPSNLCDNRNATVVQNAAFQSSTIPARRSKTIVNLVDEFEVIEVEKRKELDIVTHSLHEVRTSIEDSEANEEKLGSEKVQKLCADVKAYEIEREKIIKGMRFVEEHREDMAMSANDLEKAMHKYKTRLEECDRLIAQADSDVLEELEVIAQNDFNRRAEEQRLKSRGQELLQEVQYSAAVKTLMKLGPSGMATLLAKLETKNVSLIAMAEEVMIERAVSSLDRIFRNNEPRQ